MPDAREYARSYIVAGLRPIPVYPPSAGCRCGGRCKVTSPCPGKVPRDPHWADRPYFTAEDFEMTDNIALAMGAQPSGKWLVALDVDGALDLTPYFGVLPETLMTRTGRGTHHIYEVRPETPLGNWRDVIGTRDKLSGYKPGFWGALDLRYARGAVVAAPSTHRTGVEYETTTAPIVMLPDRVISWIMRDRATRKLPVDAYWSRDGKRA
jgi:hypothetical protein